MMSKPLQRSPERVRADSAPYTNTHTYTYICIYVCVKYLQKSIHTGSQQIHNHDFYNY